MAPTLKEFQRLSSPKPVLQPFTEGATGPPLAKMSATAEMFLSSPLCLAHPSPVPLHTFGAHAHSLHSFV